MARAKRETVFTEAAGKTVKSIKYEENPDCQALEVAFSDGTLLSFEFRARVTVQGSYLRTQKETSALSGTSTGFQAILPIWHKRSKSSLDCSPTQSGNGLGESA